MKQSSLTADNFNRNKWLYSLGGTGRDMAYTLFTQFLLTFVLFTREITTAQFSALGVILTVCRIWDGINDPVMGGIVENTRTKFGKFKPWILIGAVTNAAVLVAMFTNKLQGWSFVVFFGIMYLIWDITYTMNDIGYWSMLPSLTSDPHRRDSVTSMANLFAGLGTIISTGLVPILTAGNGAIGGNSITAYAVVASFIACNFVACQSMTCIGVKETRIAKQPLEEHIGLKKMFLVIIHNDQLLWVTLIMLVSNLGGALLTAFGTNYLYLEFGYKGMNVTLFAAFYAASAGLINFIYPMLSKRLTRAAMAKIALTATLIGYASFWLTGTFAPQSVKLGVFCAEALIIGFGYSLFYLVVTICLTNTIEYNEYKTGSRDEAIIFSLRPFMAKMSSALQQVILTLVYIVIGMTNVTNSIADVEQRANLGSITEGEKTQLIAGILESAPPKMAMMLRLFMVLIPVVFLTVAYILMKKKTTIDETEYARMLKVIEERKREAETVLD